MTLWATSETESGIDSTIDHHPGGPAAIRQFTDTGILLFPDWHDMSRWQYFSVLEERFGQFICRFGDSIKFEDLPQDLQTENVANFLGADKLENVIGNSRGTLVCGSQDEIEPDPTLDDYFDINLYDEDTLDSMYRPSSQRQTVWTLHALFSEDQLRQRMAWALSQILVISPNLLTDSRATEPFLVYYDIFVRNGLGNYKDVLKEVSFSVKMGEYLTYKYNKAIASDWHPRRKINRKLAVVFFCLYVVCIDLRLIYTLL